MIHNGDFSKGLAGWKWAHYGKRGKGEVEIIYDEEKASDVLYYKRTLSHSDGGAVWISQDLNIDVDKYSELVLEFDGKVIANTLKDSGWWRRKIGVRSLLLTAAGYDGAVMARPLRLEFPGALYHITSRGNGGQEIFTDDEDRLAFLEIPASLHDSF